ncbi:MAG: hypothetical protein Q9195_003545 [Heterodermia aff. obscurata]
MNRFIKGTEAVFNTLQLTTRDLEAAQKDIAQRAERNAVPSYRVKISGIISVDQCREQYSKRVEKETVKAENKAKREAAKVEKETAKAVDKAAKTVEKASKVDAKARVNALAKEVEANEESEEEENIESEDEVDDEDCSRTNREASEEVE